MKLIACVVWSQPIKLVNRSFNPKKRWVGQKPYILMKTMKLQLDGQKWSNNHERDASYVSMRNIGPRKYVYIFKKVSHVIGFANCPPKYIKLMN